MESNRRDFLTETGGILAGIAARGPLTAVVASVAKLVAGCGTDATTGAEDILPDTDECVGTPAETLTDPILQDINTRAEEILKKVLDILKNASNHEEIISKSGGGPISPDKTVQATFGNETVQIRSNDEDFDCCIYTDLVDGTFSDHKSLSLHREYSDADRKVIEQYFRVDMDPRLDHSYAYRTSHICLPDQPTRIRTEIIKDGRFSIEDLGEIPSDEYFRLVRDVRAEVQKIMNKHGIDVSWM